MIRLSLVTVGGLGLLRPAPGTWGSLPPAALCFVMLTLGAPAWSVHAALAAVLVASSLVCLTLGGWAERRFSRKDASAIVADETAGQCLPLLLWPDPFMVRCRAVSPDGSLDWNGAIHAACAVGAAFLLFRLFDILKPPPARGLQRLDGGLGVLIDDLIAGIYAAIPVLGVLYFLA